MSRSWVTADARVFEGGGVVSSLTLVSDGVGVADVTLYDGPSAAGENILTLRALQNDTRHLPYPDPLEVLDGLFVDVGSNVSGLLVVWRRG